MGTIKIPAAEVLKKIYGETEESSARYTNLAVNFEKKYHHDKAEFFTAPGRTEIIGNHVDHNGGQIIAASIDLDTIGAAYPNGTNVIHMISEGYKQEVVVDLDKLSTETYTKGTDALVAGIMEYMQKKGYATGGFDAYVSTKVIAAAGVSSSASFEMLVCAITNYFFNEGKQEYGEYARAGQYAENVYWKKASGLMDQMASSVGNIITIDFADPAHPDVEPVQVDFSKAGLALCILDSCADHADLTDEYAAVPAECRAVAAVCGGEVLRDVPFDTFLAKLPECRRQCGDRAVLRAFHFYADNDRVAQQVATLRGGDFDAFLQLVTASGNSSWEYLQNVIPAGYKEHQEMGVTIAAAKHYLQGKGAVRVHGGGFAGTAQAFVPVDMLADFKAHMEAILGEGRCHVLSIRPEGGAVL